ncbi:hypothetical protein [Roseisalinus antarcticus]|uniref:Chromosome partition protein Smc n=1 Tax=Roseisalinus antarcticus TaxID=254357 RepID=A0A1Y5TWE4_9RHOB|nr:hypothetical protein [Roseisalinus antarcticus]SLN75291.1 Chromosome partition protein Smc [Roseisalinus antarcticus]
MLFRLRNSTTFAFYLMSAVLILILLPISALPQTTCEQFEIGVRTQLDNDQPIVQVCEIALENGCSLAECADIVPAVCGQNGAGCSEEVVAHILSLNADISRLEAEFSDSAKRAEELRSAVEEAARRNSDLESRIAELEAGQSGEPRIDQLREQLSTAQARIAELEAGGTGGPALSEALARIQTLEADLELAEQQRFLAQQAAAQAANALTEMEVERDAVRAAEESLRRELSNMKTLRDWAASEVHASLEGEVARLSEGGCAPLEVRQSIAGELPVFTVSGQATTDVVASISALDVPEWADFVVEIAATDRAGCAVTIGNFTFLEIADSPEGVTIDGFVELGVATTDLAPASASGCAEIGNLIEINPEFEAYRAATARSMRGAWLADEVQGSLRVVSCVRGGSDTAVYRVSQRPDAFAPYLVFLAGQE